MGRQELLSKVNEARAAHPVRLKGSAKEDRMGKSCFLFPRSGCARGRAWAASSPRRCRPRWRSIASGARHRASISRSSASTLRSRSSSTPRCNSRPCRDVPRHPGRRSAPRGSSPTSSSGTRSGSSPRSLRCRRWERARRSASCASGGLRWRRQPDGTRARWRRSSGSRTRRSRTFAARSSASGLRTTTARARS